MSEVPTANGASPIATAERFIAWLVKDRDAWVASKTFPIDAMPDYTWRKELQRIQSFATYDEVQLACCRYMAHPTMGMEFASDRWALLCNLLARDPSQIHAVAALSKSKRFPSLETEPSEEDILNPSPIIVHGLMEAGDKMVIGGGSKSYKTWSFIDLGLSIAHGAKWWGLQCVQSPVVYVNFEIKGKNFWKRVFTVRRARGFNASGSLYVWNLRGQGFTLDDNFDDLIKFVLQVGAKVIILDPIYKLYGRRNENALGDMATLFDLIDRVCAATGASVVYGAHFAKGSTLGKDAMERISGSGGFQRDPDCIMTLTRLDESQGCNAFTVSTTLRDMPPIQDFGLTWDFPLMVPTEGLNLKNLHNAAKPAKKYNVSDMLGVLQAKPLATSEWQQACKETLGMGRGTFYDYLPEAKSKAINVGGIWRAA